MPGSFTDSMFTAFISLKSLKDIADLFGERLEYDFRTWAIIQNPVLQTSDSGFDFMKTDFKWHGPPDGYLIACNYCSWLSSCRIMFRANKYILIQEIICSRRSE